MTLKPLSIEDYRQALSVMETSPPDRLGTIGIVSAVLIGALAGLNYVGDSYLLKSGLVLIGACAGYAAGFLIRNGARADLRREQYMRELKNEIARLEN